MLRCVCLALVPIILGCDDGKNQATRIVPTQHEDNPNVDVLREYVSEGSSTGCVELRLGERDQKEGTTEFPVQDSNRRVFLYPDVLFTGKDILKSRLEFDRKYTMWMVEAIFRPEATERLAKVTGANEDKVLALLVDGRVVLDGTIRSPISNGHLHISGKLTKDEADRLAKQLVGH